MTQNSRLRLAVAFTLVEMVVSISIAAVLLSVLLVALGAARESGRNAQCKSNMRQLGIGIQTYESAHKFLPSGSGSESELGVNRAIGSVWYQAAAVLEITPLPLASYAVRADGSPGRLLYGHSVLSCPSDTVIGGCSYRGCGGASYSMNEAEVENESLGPFVSTRPVKLTECVDGLSYTALAAEKLKGEIDGAVSADEMWATRLSFVDPLFSIETLKNVCSGAPSSSRFVAEYSGGSWAYPGLLFTNYNHAVVPNLAVGNDCSPDAANTGASPVFEAIARASSNHSGGVNVVFLDGSVRFVSDTLSARVWKALGTRNGGELDHDL